MKKRRIFLSIVRRKMNYLIFIVLMLISVLLLSVIMIHQSTEKNIEDIIETYGTNFVLRYVRDETNPDYWQQITTATGYSGMRYLGPNVDYDMLDRIMAEVDGIAEYESGRDWTVMLTNYKLIEGFQGRLYRDYIEHPEKDEANQSLSAEELKYWPYITYSYTVCSSKNDEQFCNGYFEITEGRHIVPEDEGVVIISKKLADLNGLKIGDTMTVEAESLYVDYGAGIYRYPIAEVDVEIIGLFEMTYQQNITAYTQETDILENWIYVDRHTGRFLDEVNGYSDQLTGGHFYVENQDEMDAVMEKVRALDWIDWKYYTVMRDDTEYDYVTKPLKNIKLMMFAAGLLVGILGLVLISLLVTHNVKNRKHEWGIFVALGIPVREIKKQVRTEYLVIMAVSFAAAMVVCLALAPVLGNGIYQGVKGDSTIKEYTQEEIEAAIVRGDNELASEMSKNMRQGIPMLEELLVEINIPAVVVVMGIEMLIVLLFVRDELNSTLKSEPRGILSMIR